MDRGLATDPRCHPRVLDNVHRQVCHGTQLGARVVIISLDGSRPRYAIRLYFLASNNVVEYKALINGLRIAIELGAT